MVIVPGEVDSGIPVRQGFKFQLALKLPWNMGSLEDIFPLSDVCRFLSCPAAFRHGKKQLSWLLWMSQVCSCCL
jgi:hypothetical protein